jgi:malonyl-CoA/methylmalonyl-CoA synthetase
MSGHFLNDLRTTFANRAHQTAVIHRGVHYTFDKLAGLAERCASRLHALGVQTGDRVALCTPSKLEFLVAHFGTLFAGAVSLPLNPRLTHEELKYFLADSGASLAIAAPEPAESLRTLQAALPDLRRIVADAELLHAPDAMFHSPGVPAEFPCFMLYSSGTTGWPKGVVHTNANVASALHSLQRLWQVGPNDSVVNLLPLFHIHGLSIATHLSLLAGASIRIEDSFHPLAAIEAIGQATVFMAVPTIYYQFLEQPAFRAAASSWAHVRLFTCGSAPIRPEVLSELETILGRPVVNRYGMTESFIITSLPIHRPEGAQWSPGSVGLPLDGVEVRLSNIQDGVGSVQIRGPNIFSTYWNKPDATRAAFDSGWFDTGDLGHFDAAGHLVLVGRKHDLIITNGYNVYPQIVERVLNECPGVRESAVAGLPDPRRGERVAAFIVKSDAGLAVQRVLDHCAERLVNYQRPLDVFFVDALPRNALGKVVRRDLQAQVGAPPAIS